MTGTATVGIVDDDSQGEWPDIAAAGTDEMLLPYGPIVTFSRANFVLSVPNAMTTMIVPGAVPLSMMLTPGAGAGGVRANGEDGGTCHEIGAGFDG
jgi:hypothetical protein